MNLRQRFRFTPSPVSVRAQCRPTHSTRARPTQAGRLVREREILSYPKHTKIGMDSHPSGQHHRATRGVPQAP